MVRNKIFTADVGFYELAVAAPSRKAAAEAMGLLPSAFQHGIARQMGDAKAVEAAMAQPGKVVRRPLGSKLAFAERAELPKLPRGKKTGKKRGKPH